MQHAIDANPSDGKDALSRADRLLFKLETAFDLIAAASIFFLMVMGVAQVLGRKLFNAPIFGYIDIVEQAMALFAFLGVAYCQRFGGHVRMELFLGNMSGRTLWIVEGAAILFSLAVITVFIPESFNHFLRAWEFGDSTINAELPVWPSKLVVPVAFTVLWLRLLLQLIGFIRLSITPDATPIAVPVIHDVETKAKLEIDEALGEMEDAEQDYKAAHPDAGPRTGPGAGPGANKEN